MIIRCTLQLGFALAICTAPLSARAEPLSEASLHLSAGGVASNLDAGGELRLSADLSRAFRLGLRLRGLAIRETYVAGFAENDGIAVEALPYASVRLARFKNAELRLRLGVGGRGNFVDSPRDDASARLLTEIGPMVLWRAAPAWTFNFGWIQRTDLELSPTTDIAVLGSVFRVGATARLSERWALYGESEFGGVFGYGGDNEKVQVRGAIGLRVALDAPTPIDSSPAEHPGTIGGFVTLEWRAMTLAGHFSHGPGFSAGVRLFDGLLRVGIAGFARPGPINPETFEITPAGGMTYKGQNQLSLRSDGAFVGLLLESELAMPGLPALKIIPTVTLGNAGFGFYLTGDDRDTPDGRRVSVWEDELQDGKDAGVAFGIEPGVRIAYRPASAFVSPYVAVRYLYLLGYEAFAENSYDGFSFSAGVAFEF